MKNIIFSCLGLAVLVFGLLYFRYGIKPNATWLLLGLCPILHLLMMAGMHNDNNKKDSNNKSCH